MDIKQYSMVLISSPKFHILIQFKPHLPVFTTVLGALYSSIYHTEYIKMLVYHNGMYSVQVCSNSSDCQPDMGCVHKEMMEVCEPFGQ